MEAPRAGEVAQLREPLEIALARTAELESLH